MTTLRVGVLWGTVLGALDGLSAVFVPEARPMLAFIVGSATIKGMLTGVGCGLAARRLESVRHNALAGLLIGGTLSVLAALPTGDYLQIVPTGLIVGVLTGLLVGRWDQRARLETP